MQRPQTRRRARDRQRLWPQEREGGGCTGILEPTLCPDATPASAHHVAGPTGSHLGQLAVLVFHDDLVFLQLLQLGFGGHLLQLQLLAGALLLLQLFLQFLPRGRGDCEEGADHTDPPNPTGGLPSSQLG